jgi:hypothetical protein
MLKQLQPVGVSKRLRHTRELGKQRVLRALS